MRQVFSSAKMAPDEGLRRYTEISRREFYDGDLVVEGGDRFDIQLDQVLAAPVTINHVKSNAQMSYKRANKHIRRDRSGFKVITIVETGSIKFIRSSECLTVNGGYASIVDIDQPFLSRHIPNLSEPYEAFQIVVPPDLFFKHLSEAELFIEPFNLNGTHGDIVRALLRLFVRHGTSIAASTAQHLSLSLLEALAYHLQSGGFEMPKRRSIKERRWSEVENYILMHLTNPNLSCDVVAHNCDISTRYLSYLLKENNITFSDLVWKNRILKAKEWLLVDRNPPHSIDQISHMTGFKNPSHFSRKFKEMYGHSPSQYRCLFLAGMVGS